MNTTDSTNAPAGSSKRYQQFHSALQLATQRASNKWTFQDFEECFPLWCSEEREGAQSGMSTLAREMQSSIEQSTEDILQGYQAAEAIDVLHKCVIEARARKEAGQKVQDAWRADLEPRAAVRARTVPVLKRERDRLNNILTELEKGNKQLSEELRNMETQRLAADAQSNKLLDALEETVNAFASLEQEDIVNWTLTSLETSGSDVK